MFGGFEGGLVEVGNGEGGILGGKEKGGCEVDVGGVFCEGDDFFWELCVWYGCCLYVMWSERCCELWSCKEGEFSGVVGVWSFGVSDLECFYS